VRWCFWKNVVVAFPKNIPSTLGLLLCPLRG
jgi:hypothetical protein